MWFHCAISSGVRSSTLRVDPVQEILVGSAGQDARFECLRIDLQKIEQMLVEPDRDVVVILDVAGVP